MANLRVAWPGVIRAALAAVLLTLAAGDGAAQSAGVGPPSGIRIAVQDGLLSARVEAAPLEAVLEAVALQADLAIEVSGDLGVVRPQEFERLPLAAGLRRLVGDRGLIMVFEPLDGDPQGRLSKVQVYGNLVPDPNARPVRGQQARRTGAPPSYGELAGQSRQARLRAIRGLARRQDEASIGLLSALVARDPEVAVRRMAASTLGDSGGAAAAAALEAALADPDAEVRMHAMQGLQGIEGEQAAPLLSELALQDEDAGVRRLAVELLAALQGDGARSTIEFATSDPDATVRAAAEQALRRSGR